MGNAAKELFRKIADAVPKVLNDLKNALGELILAGAAKVGEFANDMIAAGENLVHGIVDGIGNAARSVIDAIGGVINDAIGWAKSLLGIASPSKVFRSIGGYVSEGFADGIAAKAGEAVGATFAAAPAGGQTTNNYYTIEKVDLSGDPAAVKAAGTLWNGVRRQMRMGAI